MNRQLAGVLMATGMLHASTHLATLKRADVYISNNMSAEQLRKEHYKEIKPKLVEKETRACLDRSLPELGINFELQLQVSDKNKLFGKCIRKQVPESNRAIPASST